MKAQRRWSIAGTIFTLAAGALLHFTYQWFGGIFWAAVGAVNESTWEHLKLLFFPALLFLLVEYLISGRPSEGFFPATLLALLCGMGAITVLFYTYTGILGCHTMIADLAIFAIATVLTFCLSYRWWVSPPRWFCKTWVGWVSVILLAGLLACFVVFTFLPPQLGWFLDPASNGYGKAKP